MPNHNENLERLLDLVAEALIQSPLVPTPETVEENQTFIRNGLLQKGAGEGILALFQKDVKANQQDLIGTSDDGTTLTQYAELIDFENFSVSIDVLPQTGLDTYLIVVNTNQTLPFYDITYLVQSGDEFEDNPLNISQFIPIDRQKSIVDVEQAEEYLDTNIFELLPTGDTRQSRIIRFFQELNALLPPQTPEFDLTDSGGNTPGDGRVDRLPDGTWSGSVQYSRDNSISYVQDNQDGNIDEEDAFIHRLKDTANDTNFTRTIEDIYNTIEPYLRDILEDEISLEDERPEYVNKSKGYLQFRDLNQGIIIRNTNQDFIEGLNPNNLTYLNQDNTGGFTITMWVRFLDKVSEGTLFNFGNPLREDNPFGFTLDTFVLSPDSPTGLGGGASTFEGVNGYSSVVGSNNPNGTLFENTNTERFVRLIVHDSIADRTWDSHTANPHSDKQTFTPFVGADGITGSNILSMFNNTRIPEDFNEWYFICASFNPTVIEPMPDGSSFESELYESYRRNHNFWLNHIEATGAIGSFTNFSGYGNKCKVEIISKTDLLRARGFKV